MTDKKKDDADKPSGKNRDENETHRGWKSKWVETSPRAEEPVTEEEMKGHNIPGNGAAGTT